MAKGLRHGHTWTSVGSGREHAVTYYLDFQSFQQQGQKVTVWELMDFDKPQEFKGANWKFLSSQLQIEFDCDARLSRVLSLSVYKGNMATVEMVYSADFPSPPWESIPPDSVEKVLWNSACVKE